MYAQVISHHYAVIAIIIGEAFPVNIRAVRALIILHLPLFDHRPSAHIAYLVCNYQPVAQGTDQFHISSSGLVDAGQYFIEYYASPVIPMYAPLTAYHLLLPAHVVAQCCHARAIFGAYRCYIPLLLHAGRFPIFHDITSSLA